MGKIHETQQFFETSRPQGHFFEKKQLTFFIDGLAKCVFQISLIVLSEGRVQTDKPAHICTSNTFSFVTWIFDI